ncbi:hypothetical protein N7470_005983 [Penicillium chermesinum]|nr:hypothetical protein N7470_005983 [Penicillium chermesinum]
MSEITPVAQVPAAEPEKAVEAVEANKPAETSAGEPATEEAPKADEPAAEPPKDAPAGAEPEALKADKKPEEKKPELPAYITKIPSLAQFFEKLPKILSDTGYTEMWGVELKDTADIPTVNVLIKFLRANEGNLPGAETQLRKALEWRKEVKPLELVESGKFSASKYKGLGYLTAYEKDGRPLIFTWNIYGAVKDIANTFGDSDEFVKWRAALMELAVQDLKLKDATEVIDYDGEKDPYQMIQVHDYLNVKFFRVDPTVRTATKKTIDVFSTAYPELLREKFFVNVPGIMGWMFSAMKLILSRNTTRKFHPITNGANLAREFPASVSEQIPAVYGGKGPALDENGRTVQLVEDGVKEDKPAEEPVAKAEAPAKESAVEEVAKGKPTQEEPVTEDASKEEPKGEAKEEAKEESK